MPKSLRCETCGADLVFGWKSNMYCERCQEGLGDKLGRVFIVLIFLFILALLVSGLWAECTNTSPEWYDFIASR